MINQLHQFIGNEITYMGNRCQLIEILQDQPAFVLMCMEQHMSIQGDMHGNAHRMVNKTYTISCLSETHNDLHPVAKEILPDHMHDQLLEFLLNERTHS